MVNLDCSIYLNQAFHAKFFDQKLAIVRPLHPHPLEVSEAKIHMFTKMGGFKKPRNIHICVVGAGIAGLRCAGVLLEKGVRVTILEARDRIGGRVRYQYLPKSDFPAMLCLPSWLHSS